MIRKLCNVEQLPAEGGLRAFIDTDPSAGMALCVGVLEGVPFAVDNVCPHQRAPLSAGRLEGEYVVCPLHGWRWRLRDGKADFHGDPPIGSYEVRRYGDEVFVRIPMQAGAPHEPSARRCGERPA